MSSSAIHDQRATRGRRRIVAVVAAALLTATLASPAGAGAPVHSYVLEWNAHALNAIFNAPFEPPPFRGPARRRAHRLRRRAAPGHGPGRRVRRGQCHRGRLPAVPRGTGSASSGASQDAAVVTAAYDVLVHPTLRLPAARLRGSPRHTRMSIDDIEVGTEADNFAAGVAAGHAAADAMIDARTAPPDGRFPAFPFSHPIWRRRRRMATNAPPGADARRVRLGRKRQRRSC